MTDLIADIGATNARFALLDQGNIREKKVLPCAEHEGLAEAALAYLSQTKARPARAAIAIAAPLDGSDRIDMVNHPWTFSQKETQKALGLSEMRLVNDFEANAHAVPALTEADYYALDQAHVQPGRPACVIGPGTGLGVAGIIAGNVIATEGGHVTMPAQSPREMALFDYLLRTKYHHISAERVASGKGLVNVYNAIVAVDALDLPERAPEEITGLALKKSCAACVETVDLFCHFLGVAAGNLALSYGAFGGVYVAGGIIPKLGEAYFRASRFYRSFCAKGRFSEYMTRIPVRVVVNPDPAFVGLKRLLS